MIMPHEAAADRSQIAGTAKPRRGSPLHRTNRVSRALVPKDQVRLVYYVQVPEQLNILVLAYVYPPDAGSGTYRTLYFSNYWAEAGDNVTVVTVKESHFHPGALVDPALVRKVDPSIKVVRASAMRPLERLLGIRDRLRRRVRHRPTPPPLRVDTAPAIGSRKGFLTRAKDALTSLLTFPDAHVGWIPGAVRAGLRLARIRRIDCLYASGGPWSGVVAATILHRMSGLPLVLDFRDPWANSPNLIEASGLARAAHSLLEAFCVKRASRIITNTSELRNDFLVRYPLLGPDRFVCITNGFEEPPQAVSEDSGRFTLVHAGELYLSRNPANFLRAVEQLIQEGSIARQQLRVRFVGGIATRDGELASLLDALGEVVEITPRLPYAEALRIQQGASALLLFQTGLPLQIPRKLYEYLSLRRPILAITESGSATARVLQDLGSHCICDDEVAAIKSALGELYRRWQIDETFVVDEATLDAYSNRQLAAKLRQELQLAATAS